MPAIPTRLRLILAKLMTSALDLVQTGVTTVPRFSRCWTLRVRLGGFLSRRPAYRATDRHSPELNGPVCPAIEL